MEAVLQWKKKVPPFLLRHSKIFSKLHYSFIVVCIKKEKHFKITILSLRLCDKSFVFRSMCHCREGVFLSFGITLEHLPQSSQVNRSLLPMTGKLGSRESKSGLFFLKVAPHSKEKPDRRIQFKASQSSEMNHHINEDKLILISEHSLEILEISISFYNHVSNCHTR